MLRHLRLMLLVVGAIGAIAAPVHAQTLPNACTNFSDDPIQPGITTVRTQHIDELRACINALRGQLSLAAVNWTDSLQAQQTWIRAVHVVELRSALAELYAARGLSSPVYTDAGLSAQATLVRAVHITEIRNAILVVAGVCPPDGCNEVIECYHVDAVGSVRAVTDEAGAVILRRDYYPFGEGVGSDGSTSLGFTGQEADPESGLNYAGARYYRAWTGRFTTVDPASPDPSDPQRWNRYAYALNTPLVNIDPTGLSSCRAGFDFCSGVEMTHLGGSGGWDQMPFQQSGGGGLTAAQRGFADPTSVLVGLDRSEFEARDQAAGARRGSGTTSFTVTVNARPADIPGGHILDSVGIDHQWITTSTGISVGMGPQQGVPQSDAPLVPTFVVDHTGQIPTRTMVYTNADQAAVMTYLQVGRPLGPWIPGVNDCNTWVASVIQRSTPHTEITYMYTPYSGYRSTTYTNVVVYADGTMHKPGGGH